MLSNETKLKRINEKLSLFDLRIEFGCFDLKTYRPLLRGVKYVYSSFRNYKGVETHIGWRTEGNKVIFYVKEIKPHGFSDENGFHNFAKVVGEIDKILSYCNNLGLEVPKYKNEGRQI